MSQIKNYDNNFEYYEITKLLRFKLRFNYLSCLFIKIVVEMFIFSLSTSRTFTVELLLFSFYIVCDTL